jgi:flagellar hook-associated protein 3 FlgL
MNTRITHTMVQRNVLADLNAASNRLSKTQSKIASNKEIEKPSDNPYGTSQAMALRQSLAATKQYQRNIEDAAGWQDATEQALDQITSEVQRARTLLVQGGTETDHSSRESVAAELEQIIQGIKQNANATYRGSYLFAGSKTDTPPYEEGPADNYFGDNAGWQGTDPGIVREIGPGVSLTINTVGREFLGDGPTGDDGKLLDVLRDAVAHLRADDGASIRDIDLKGIDTNLDSLLEVRARNGARSNRLESAQSRLAEVEEATVKQLSQTEDADIAKTLIDFNSQQAAYQSALRAGASLVQNSLLDFLR